MIKIRDLKRNFKEYDFEINCQSLTVDTGTVCGICGRTASGKTLFSQVVSGIIKNYSGSIEIGMTELSSTYRKKIGYIPFKNVLYNDMTLKEMTVFLLNQYKVPESEFDLKLNWFSQFYDIKDLVKRRISCLTDGQLQYIKYFVSLIHSPSVLVIDEPFNGLGDESAELVRSLFEEVNRKGVTVLALSSHEDYLKKSTGCVHYIIEGKIE